MLYRAARSMTERWTPDVLELRKSGLAFRAIAERLEVSTSLVEYILAAEERRLTRAKRARETGLSDVRALNCLVSMVGDTEQPNWAWGLPPDAKERLRAISDAELLECPNLGRGTLRKLRAWSRESANVRP